ncbi:hypothetical protein GGR52DRAFT_531803 [Hypoxylon sp. FL1284]|nr:hypothetical protein GGR52DRAFT_531803 [Hypoxylon sp. FL1284]
MTLKTGVVDVQGLQLVTRAPGIVPPMNYVVPPEGLGETPDYVDCWYCKERRKTKVSYVGSSQTQLAAVLCCLCCGILPGIIPICCNWRADTEHVCEKCGRLIARRPHDGKMEAFVPPQQQRAPAFKQSKFAGMDQQTRDNLDPERRVENSQTETQNITRYLA